MVNYFLTKETKRNNFKVNQSVRNIVIGILLSLGIPFFILRKYHRRSAPKILPDGSELFTGHLQDGTFYRELVVKNEMNSDFGVLLLHGAAFSSLNWETLGKEQYIQIITLNFLIWCQ